MFNEPVCKDSFFDRADILAILDKRVCAFKKGYRQNIALLGQEHIGKTSIIYNFLSSHKEDGILPIYIPLIQGQSIKEFTLRFTQALLYSYLSSYSQGTKEIEIDIDSLTGKASVRIPKTVDVLKRLRQMAQDRDVKEEEIFGQLFELPSIISNETGRLSLIILDEFHLLQTTQLKDPFKLLGNKIMLGKSTMFIMVSSKVTLAKRLLKEELNLLFGSFELIDVEPFDDATSERFLRHNLSELLTTQQGRFIIWLTGGVPFYLDIIATKMKERARQLSLNTFNTQDIAEVIFSLLFDPRGSLYSYFKLRLGNVSSNGRDPMSYISIMVACACGARRLSDISTRVGRRLKDISSQINRLADIGTFSKNASFCKLSDNLFRFWLEYEYSRQMSSFFLSPELNAREVIKTLEKIILHFIQESDRPIYERIAWLFQHMGNEQIDIDGKRLHLARFHSIKPIQPYPWLFICQDSISSTVWLYAVKENYVTESEVMEFIDIVNKSGEKPSKKIIIALSGMALNARLIAKEKRILIWDIKEVNTLMDFYGGDRIIKDGQTLGAVEE